MISKIYLMQSSVTGQYKIGVSKNPERRRKELQTGHGGILVIRQLFPTVFAYAIEAKLHTWFENERKTGEFFELSDDDVGHFGYLCELYEQSCREQNNYWDF